MHTIQTKVLGVKEKKCDDKRNSRPWDPEVHTLNKKCKEKYKAWQHAEDKEAKKDSQLEFRSEKRKLVKLVKKKRREKEAKALEKVEEEKGENPRKYWQALKKFNKKKDRKRPPEELVDEKGEVVREEAVIELWEETFKHLGAQDLKDARYDSMFALNQIEQFNGLKDKKIDDNDDPLAKPIELDEVGRAIFSLRSGKAYGQTR